jgi:hypothetical protein
VTERPLPTVTWTVYTWAFLRHPDLVADEVAKTVTIGDLVLRALKVTTASTDAHVADVIIAERDLAACMLAGIDVSAVEPYTRKIWEDIV